MEKSEDASEQAASGEKVKYLFYISCQGHVRVKYLFYISCQGRIIYAPDQVYMMTNLKSPIIGMHCNIIFYMI